MANRINVVLGIDLSPFQKSLARVEKNLSSFSKRMEETGRTLSATISLPLALAAGASVRAFAEFEKLEKGLIAVTGNAQLAAEEMELLREVAKLPGLGFQEAVRGSINLQAVGLSAEEARKTLQGFGSALAVTGGGAAELGEVQRQLTQIISKNRILQEDFGVLQERIPLIGDALQAAFGTRNIENVRKAGVSGKEFVRRISEALAVLPETQNLTGGLANSFENLRDSVTASAVAFGKSIAEAINLESIINTLADGLADVVGWFKSLSPEAQRTILVVTGIVAAIGPLLIAISGLSKLLALATSGFAALVSPVGLVIAAVTLLAAAYLAANSRLKEGEAVRKSLNNLEKKAVDNTIQQRTEVDLLVKRLKNENTSIKEKKDIIEELKRISPEYFGQLRLNKSLVDDVTTAQKLFNAELVRSAKIQAAKEDLVEIERQLRNVVEASKPDVLQTGVNAVLSFGNAAALAARQGKTFAQNIDQTTKNLKAQREAITNVLSGLQAQGPITTDTGGRGDKTTPVGEKLTKGLVPTLQSVQASLLQVRKQFQAGLEDAILFADTSRQAVTNLVSSLAVDKFKGFRTELQAVSQVAGPIKETQDFIFGVEEALTLAEEKAKVLGITVDDLAQQKLGILSGALGEAVEKFGAGSLAVETLKEAFDKLKNSINPSREKLDKFISDFNEKVGPALQGFDQLIAQSFQNRQSAIDAYYNTEKARIENSRMNEEQKAAALARLDNDTDRRRRKLARDQAIREKALALVAATVNTAKAVTSVLANPILAGIVAALGAAQIALIASQKIPALARGGITTGPTLALIGDNPSGKEAVIPFEKMGQFLDMAGGGAIRVTGIFEVKGSDLVLVLDRAQQEKLRIR